MACACGGSIQRPAQHHGHRGSVNLSICRKASAEENKIPTVKVTGIASIAFSSVCLPAASMLCPVPLGIVGCQHASQDWGQAINTCGWWIRGVSVAVL